MTNVTTFVGYAKPYCRQHGLLKGYDSTDQTYFCKICKVATSKEEISKNFYAPYYWQQKNPFIEFKLED